MILYPRYNANDALPVYWVWETIEELIARGYVPVVTAGEAEIYWN